MHVSRLLVVGALLHATAAAAEPQRRFNADITVQQPAAFVQLPLPASTYARSQQAGLADLRIVDARGQRVPFALLPPREDPAPAAQAERPAVLYALPQRQSSGAALASPVEVLVQGDRIQVRRLAGSTAGPAGTDSPGWLVDLGERAVSTSPPQLLRLRWSGPAEFSAAFDIDSSDTLREWRAAGSGQLLALAAPGAALVQRDVVLPASPARFLRLVWRDAASAPALSGAVAVTQLSAPATASTATELPFAASPEPGAAAALHFDLGGPLPLRALDLRLPPGTRVVPARVQGRNTAAEAWQDLGQHVFYRLQRDAAVSTSPPLPLRATVRYLRLLVDPRSPVPDAAQTTLVVQAQLATLVFALQGQPPFVLQAGADGAKPGALPVATLVPQLDEERPRLGRAGLGAWTEVAAVAQAAERQQRLAALRPWLLWAVLLAGVAGLGSMVWRLVRARPAG